MPFSLLKNGRLKTYKDLPHGCHSTHPDLINADIFAFIRGEQVGAAGGDGSVAHCRADPGRMTRRLGTTYATRGAQMFLRLTRR